MSGPKRADVEAQLNIARNSQRQCANLLADIEESAIGNLLAEVEALLTRLEASARPLSVASQQLGGDLARFASGDIASVSEVAAQAQRAAAEAAEAAERARRKAAEALHLKATANETFARGEAEYERAADAVRRSGDQWYMHEEMRWAKQAKALFDQAAEQLEAAAKARREAERAAVKALNQAKQAQSAVSGALQHVRAARAEAEARRRAEEEAQRIAEQQRRDALLAIHQARAAIERLAELPHAKFFPGQAEALTRQVEAAQRALDDGRLRDALVQAQPIPEGALRLEQATRQAFEAFERQRAEAEAEASGLAAAIESADAALLATWSDDPQALDRARHALQAAQAAIADERFTDAAQQAQAAQQALRQALTAAAENRSADEKRQVIAQAVMKALGELGFEVSYEQGSRSEPFRIAGQTPDPSGKGDIDIALPLHGEVHFEVHAPHGDTTCVSTVQALQQRLETYGVRWETTDWGHAEGVADADTVQVQQKVKQTEKQKVKSKR